jgi:hypothetical protein
MSQTIGGEVVEDVKKSREADVVLITKTKVYKIYSNDASAWDSYELYKEAEKHGVPVVSAARFASTLQEGSKSTPVAGICSSRAGGRFFQIAKAGGEAVLAKAIREITNKVACQQVLDGLCAASAFGVSDAQGFIDTKAAKPLAFIDVHSIGKWIKTSSKKEEPDYAFAPTVTFKFDDVIAVAKDQLAQIG